MSDPQALLCDLCGGMGVEITDQAFMYGQAATNTRACDNNGNGHIEIYPICINGCGCRVGTEDPDSNECACDGPCTASDPDTPTYLDPAKVKAAGLRRYCETHQSVFWSEDASPGFCYPVWEPDDSESSCRIRLIRFEVIGEVVT